MTFRCTGHRILMLVGVLAAVCTQMSECSAQEAYSLYVFSSDADAVVCLNGFPIHNVEASDDATASSLDCLLFLKSGSENELTISYAPDGDDAAAEVGIIQSTVGSSFYSSIPLFGETVTEGSLDVGSYDGDTFSGEFERVGGNYVWTLTFPAAEPYGYLPYKMTYGVSEDVEDITITFTTENSEDVVYDDIDFVADHGEIDFTGLTPSAGGQYVNNSDFEKISFSFADADPEREVEFVAFIERNGSEALTEFPRQYPPSEILIDEDMVDDGTLSEGSFEDGWLVLEDQGDDTWELDFTFPEGDEFLYVPSIVSYIIESNATVTMEFINPDEDTVRYADVSLQAGVEELDLSALTPSAGGAYLDYTDFSRIRILAEGEVRLVMSLVFRNRSFSETIEFETDNSETWTWVGGQSVSEPVPTADRNAIIAILEDLIDALEGKDEEAVLDCLVFVVKDIATAEGLSEAAVRSREEDTFSDIFDSIDGDLDMTALSTQNLVFTVLSNGRVVHVTYSDGSTPVISDELSVDGRDDQLEIVPFFAKINVADPENEPDYQWKIVLCQ